MLTPLFSLYPSAKIHPSPDDHMFLYLFIQRARRHLTNSLSTNQLIKPALTETYILELVWSCLQTGRDQRYHSFTVVFLVTS